MTNTATLNAPVSRKAPYEDTEVNYVTTKAQIECLLKSYGVDGVRWTSIRNQDDILEFVVAAEVLGTKKAVAIKVSPPHIVIPKKLHGKLTDTRNINQEYRLLFYWLKSKIEAVMWGLTSIEKEFLSQIVFALPDGREASVGDMVTKAIATDAVASLPFYDRTASPQAPPHTSTPALSSPPRKNVTNAGDLPPYNEGEE